MPSNGSPPRNPRDLPQRVRDTIAAHRLLHSEDLVLAGVSGGPDSVALLHCLVTIRADLRVRLAVVHVDHRLRPDSGADAVFVQELARGLGLEAMVFARDVRAQADRMGLSLEDAARRVRYEAFEEAAQRFGAGKLALAHTADDQAETVMMRLLRGAGLTGLTAIPLARPLGDVTVIRPFLGVWRREILAYLKAQGMGFKQDATNDDPEFLRNRVRAQLLPLLERDYNPRIKMLLNQLAEQCQTDVEFLQDEAQRYWKRLVKSERSQLAIRIRAFLRQPLALQRQLVRQAIRRVQGDLAGFEFRHWLEIERLFHDRPAGTILDLPGRVSLERLQDRVVVRAHPHSAQLHPAPTGRRPARAGAANP